MYKVLIADDHKIVRDGLKMIFDFSEEFTLIGETDNGDDLIIAAESLSPDLIISDLSMPGKSIISSVTTMVESKPDVKIIVLTAYDDHEDIYLAMKQGINGYIMKDTQPEQILNIIQSVMNGFTCFQPKVHLEPETITNTVSAAFNNLTNREWDVYQCMAENLNNHQIAERLFISLPTVKTHVSSILKKTSQSNRSKAIVFAYNHGLFKEERVK